MYCSEFTLQKSNKEHKEKHTMADMRVEGDRKFSKTLINKTVVSQSGKAFGLVGDIVFETKSGELIHVVLKNPTPHIEKLELEKNKEGSILIPWSAVVAMGDYLVVNEADMVA